MECARNKHKHGKIANISEDYGDGDLELSDSDENVDEEVHVTRESKRDVSYISKSDSGHIQTGLRMNCFARDAFFL